MIFYTRKEVFCVFGVGQFYFAISGSILFFISQEEERIIVYSEIGEGSKGIWYFVYNKDYGYPANKPLEEEIKKINWELQKLKEYIAISEPVKLTEKKHRKNNYLYTFMWR
jgi:hypothetical protein